MGKVTINESTLTAIGDAIREKTGKTDLIAPGSMPTEISSIEAGGGGGIEVEPIVLTGDCTKVCAGPMASKYIELFGDTMSTNNITNANNMFLNYENSSIPFDINFDESTYRDMSNLFYKAEHLTEVPAMSNVCPSGMSSLFGNCKRLRTLPENFGADWNWNRPQSNGYSAMPAMFAGCYSLRSIPESFTSNMWGIQISVYSGPYSRAFQDCYSLDEVRNLGIQGGYQTTSLFNSAFSCCHHLKDLTFATNEDGTPKTATWRNQTIDLHYNVGYSYASSITDLENWNSGMTANERVTDDATYQALKDNPNWHTSLPEYSRYNHDSAVNTINSLPDTSEYLAASSGSTNTIKFTGASGSATDGGAINTLTEEEIAVAAAKGWTVTLV